MSDYTKGEWEEVTHSWSDIGIYCDKKHIAKLSIYDEATEDTEHDLHYEMFANARLISAAPDLLEALEEAVHSLEYVDSLGPLPHGWAERQERIEKAKAAIAKAR